MCVCMQEVFSGFMSRVLADPVTPPFPEVIPASPACLWSIQSETFIQLVLQFQISVDLLMSYYWGTVKMLDELEFSVMQSSHQFPAVC